MKLLMDYTIVLLALATWPRQLNGNGSILIKIDRTEKINPLFCQETTCHYTLKVCLRAFKDYREDAGCAHGEERYQIYPGNLSQTMEEKVFSFTYDQLMPTKITLEMKYGIYGTNRTHVMMQDFLIKPQTGDQSFFFGARQFDSLQVEGRVLAECQKNYYGADCSRVCDERDGQKRFKCGRNGVKICNRGWSGVNCDTAICSMGCSLDNGFCTSPNTCQCREGWRGRFCNECIKYPGCKNGHCLDAPYTCKCQKNWTGKFCDINLYPCDDEKRCKNNGICKSRIDFNNQTLMSSLEEATTKSLPIDLTECICLDGFKGDDCHEKTDVCEMDTCLHGKCTRIDKVFNHKSYVCKCDKGWEGINCERFTDQCTKTSCKNNGKCYTVGPGEVKCDCPPGYIGDECEIQNNCPLLSGCKYARNCTIDVTGRAKCNCLDSWSGANCDEKRNICDVNPCQNRGKCHQISDGYFCECRAGFYGKQCEMKKGCLGTECLNGGVCKLGANKEPYCVCQSSFTGSKCQELITGCKPNPCRNNATCFDVRNEIFCKCNSGYRGRFCEEFVLNEDKRGVERKNECSNHGFMDGDKCTCQIGWQGPDCATMKDLCQENPCLNGSTCFIDQHEGKQRMECLCKPGYFGVFCERRMLPSVSQAMEGDLCRNDGLFNEERRDCVCGPGYFGRWCEHEAGEERSSLGPCEMYENKICLNRGTCINDPSNITQFTCICQDPYYGKYCHLKDEVKKNLCLEGGLSCNNNGVCIENGKDIMCHCNAGYEGKYCQVKIDPCLKNPCKNQGICVTINDRQQCNCKDGFQGLDCSENIDECKTNECSHGSVCLDEVNGYKCKCPEGRSGRLCDIVPSPRFINHPSCLYKNATFDHLVSWMDDCNQCHCNLGKVECQRKFCGIVSCRNPDDRLEHSCANDETCSLVMSPTTNECLIEPCSERYACQSDENLELSNAVVARNNCRANNPRVSLNCVSMSMKLAKKELPYGVYLEDICQSINSYKTSLESVLSYELYLDCALNGNEEEFIEVTVTFTTDQDFSMNKAFQSSPLNAALNETKSLIEASYREDIKNRIKNINFIDAYEREYYLTSLTKVSNKQLDQVLHIIIIKAIRRVDNKFYYEGAQNNSEEVNDIIVHLIFISTAIITILLIVLIWAFAKKKRNELITGYLEMAKKTPMDNAVTKKPRNNVLF